jgi:hypothetical protein
MFYPLEDSPAAGKRLRETPHISKRLRETAHISKRPAPGSSLQHLCRICAVQGPRTLSLNT